MFDKIKAILSLNGLLSELWDALDGKKTIIGATSLVLWFLIYAAPVAVPDLPILPTIGHSLQKVLVALGLDLSGELLQGGVAVGLDRDWETGAA